jgi:hypothetical protein
MNKLQDLSPRTRWQGWTIVEKSGRMVTDRFREPFVWKLKVHAEETKEEGQRVVRCELKTIVEKVA